MFATLNKTHLQLFWRLPQRFKHAYLKARYQFISVHKHTSFKIFKTAILSAILVVNVVTQQSRVANTVIIGKLIMRSISYHQNLRWVATDHGHLHYIVQPKIKTFQTKSQKHTLHPL